MWVRDADTDPEGGVTLRLLTDLVYAAVAATSGPRAVREDAATKAVLAAGRGILPPELVKGMVEMVVWNELA